MLKYDDEVRAIIDAEWERQTSVLRMIPSENIVSDDVLEALGSCFVNKYAEGYPSKRYYQGQANNDALERLACERACALFGAEHANVQSYSGSPANMAAYMALCEPGDRTVGLGLNSGGHLTHGWKVNFSGQLYEPHQIEVNRETERLDYDEVASLCAEIRPKVLFIGTTSYSRAFDFARLREIADSCGAYLVTDIAHVAGLVAAGAYPNPVPYADIVTMTVHKTLRGPRGGMILCKEAHAKALDRAVFPGIQGGPHMNQIAALAIALGEAARPAFKEYGHQIVKNAKCLAQALTDRGLRIVSGGTDCHLMVVDLRAKSIDGKTAATALERAGIVCNFNAIPYDPNPPRRPSGIRLGTPSLTTRGLKEAEMARVADWIVGVLDDPENETKLAQTAAEIRTFLKDYPYHHHAGEGLC
ncbi:MAG: serine hydroxymethyltransferase [Proteobacteria bacterium]|nr:serine hydroxymethyltransferase [Pseudomonadota bacterium]